MRFGKVKGSFESLFKWKIYWKLLVGKDNRVRVRVPVGSNKTEIPAMVAVPIAGSGMGGGGIRKDCSGSRF
jgi:hypothetical protein